MTGGEESRICGKLDKIQTDVSTTKESVGRIEERVHGHDDSIDRHEGNITELFKSRDDHALTLKGIKVEDDTKEKLREKYSTKKQFRITWNMWIIGLLVAAIVTVSGWCIYLLRMIAAH
jgi:hypothetical protein